MTDTEEKFKHKEKLFGNIHFIGELYKMHLIPERIVFQILQSLLALDDQKASDETLEAGLDFINKVGAIL